MANRRNGKSGEGKKAFYVEVVHGDVEPELLGPFRSELARDMEAKRQRQTVDPTGENGIFWLDLVDGKPSVGPYTGGFLNGTFSGRSAAGKGT